MMHHEDTNHGRRRAFVDEVDGLLLGSYTTQGVEDWWNRPRHQLDGKTPLQMTMGDWEPDDEGPRQVLALARSLDETMGG